MREKKKQHQIVRDCHGLTDVFIESNEKELIYHL